MNHKPHRPDPAGRRTNKPRRPSRPSSSRRSVRLELFPSGVFWTPGSSLTVRSGANDGKFQGTVNKFPWRLSPSAQARAYYFDWEWQARRSPRGQAWIFHATFWIKCCQRLSHRILASRATGFPRHRMQNGKEGYCASFARGSGAGWLDVCPPAATLFNSHASRG